MGPTGRSVLIDASPCSTLAQAALAVAGFRPGFNGLQGLFGWDIDQVALG